jgi:hypothetical protein
VGSLPPEALQPREALPLQALVDLAVACGSFGVELGASRPLRPLLLFPLPVEPLGHGLPAPERDYVSVACPKALCRNPPSPRSLIGDAIVPGKPHAAAALAASEAL